jgi:phenylacetate-CoA ligase
MILNSLSILKDLERIQYLPQHKIEELQTRKLRHVIKHAYENVRYYRELFDLAGIKPNDIKDKKDIYKIPITTKKDLQVKAPQELLSYGIKPEDCVIKYTSGSTGQPLKFFLSENERDFQSLINLRILQSTGFRLTDRTAYIINPRRFPKTKYWFQYLGILRRYYLSVFDTPETHRDALNYIKP